MRGYSWIVWALGYAVAWAAAVAYGGDMEDALPLAVVAGIVLPAIAWGLTRKTGAPAIAVARPTVELGAVMVWLAIYAVVVLGFLFTTIKQTIPPGTREHELVMLAVKLTVHVAIPALLLKALGARLAPLVQARFGAPGVPATLVVMGALLIGLVALASPSLENIAELHLPPATLAWAIPATFVWMALEAGVCEEFLFRAVLQTRLAAFLRSEAGAVVIGALLFGLAHVPGLYLRPDTSHDTIAGGLPGVIAYAVGTLSPIGILFGVLWARTRSFALVVLLHACVDVLPNTTDFIRTWM
ncbi:MAG: CPBP family intramembrane metalloprotease [Alphaproteobacteria bacterium]|nr:CPBP family intramembrane metalloprotease [Alphaproteobacteria bacterium]